MLGFPRTPLDRFGREAVQMENALLEKRMWEENPDKARENARPRLLLHLAVLAVILLVLNLLVRG